MSFAKSSIHTFGTRFILMALTMASGIINARRLGPEGLGVLVLLVLVKQTAFRFGNLGFGSAFAFFIARKKASTFNVIRVMWLTVSIVSIIMVIFMLLIRDTSFSPWNDIPANYFYLSLLTVPTVFLNLFLGRVLSGELKIAQANYASILTGVSYTSLLVLFVIVLNYGVIGSVLAIWLGDIVACLYILIWCLRDIQAKPSEGHSNSLGLMRDCWKYGRWNYLLMMSQFVFEELPLIILKKVTLDNVLIGFFATARALARQSRLIAQPISQVLFPYTASSEKHHAADRTNSLCRAYLPIMFLGVVTVAIFIKPIIRLLYGDVFLPAVPVFYTVAPGIIVWPITQFLDIHIAASGRPKFAFLTRLIILPLVVGYCFIFIPRYGYIGAGIATSMIYLTNFVSRLMIYRYVTGSKVKDIIFIKNNDFKTYKKLFGQITRKGAKWFMKVKNKKFL